MISPTLNVPQARFLSMLHKFKAYIAGFGSGKTWVGCGGICKGIWEHPGINQGYFAPTYPQIRDIFYPTVEEVAADWGLNVKINEGNKEVHFYYGRQYRGTTICRSMEKPQTIVGFKIGNALVDELDILPKEKARTAWRKIIARMRYKIDGLRNGIRENDDGTYAITAVQHVPEKEAIVDNGAHFDGDQSGTVNGVTPPAVQHLTAEVTADSGEYQVLARWDTPKVVKGVSFMLRLTVAADDGSERLVSTARTTETTYRFTQLALGNYRLTVRAANAWGQQGDPASVSFRIPAVTCRDHHRV